MTKGGRDGSGGADTGAEDQIRLDRWLVHARAFRTRALAVSAISGGGIRVNGAPCRKPGRCVSAGDVVTIAAHQRVRVLQVVAPGLRRGAAAEAALLYVDLTDGPAAGA